MAVTLKTPNKDKQNRIGLLDAARSLTQDPQQTVVFVGIAVLGGIEHSYVTEASDMFGALDETKVKLVCVAAEALDGALAQQAERLLDQAHERRTGRRPLPFGPDKPTERQRVDNGTGEILNGWDDPDGAFA
jgi:hypothetical protein